MTVVSDTNVWLLLAFAFLTKFESSVCDAEGLLQPGRLHAGCEKKDTHFHTLHLSIGHGSISACIQEDDSKKKQLLQGKLGLQVPQGGAQPLMRMDAEVLMVEYPEQQLRLTVKHRRIGSHANEGRERKRHIEATDGHEYEILWESEGDVSNLEDEFLLGEAHWYGCASVKRQLWPIEKWSRPPTAYVSGDSYNDQYGGVQERYWLSSNGVAIFVDYDVPLFVGINGSGNGKLSFSSKFHWPFANSAQRKLHLKYRVSHSSDVRSVHQHASNTYWRKPAGIPDERMFRHPIWSTWAKYKKNIDQQKVLQFATEIRQHGFKDSHLEIDDDWSSHYGDFEFDADKFPDPSGMINQLKDMDFRVTLWVQPFASPMSQAFYAKDDNGTSLWIRSSLVESLPALIYWWDGVGAALDMTNPAAVEWFLERLVDLEMTYGIDSFKYDAGESSWLPNWRTTFGNLDNPNEYTRVFAELAARSDADIRCQEVRVNVRGQHHPMFVRLMDKESDWGYDNGLRTLIPHVLTFGLLGYPFVLPDMIGGNAYGLFIIFTSLPDRELYIRWLEASALFPAIQFSVPPWQYDEEVVAIAHQILSLREKYADKIIDLARESTVTGAPIVRPLWWIGVRDEVCLTNDSEYLVGDDLLVAPVLKEGARARDVYLPSGQWVDELRGGILEGGRWYRNYEAGLRELPHFTRV